MKDWTDKWLEQEKKAKPEERIKLEKNQIDKMNGAGIELVTPEVKKDGTRSVSTR